MGRPSRPLYAVQAATLVLAQHVVVLVAAVASGVILEPDTGFWMLPFTAVAYQPALSSPMLVAVLVVGFAAIAALALLSVRRAGGSPLGQALAAMTMVPGPQLLAVLALALLPLPEPVRLWDGPVDEPEAPARWPVAVKGALAGIAIIVGATALSAAALGSYGWALFVGTPFVVGVTTGWIANRATPLSPGNTMKLVLASASLGCVALITLALEGLICLLLVSPLAAVVAILGGAAGRGLALRGHGGSGPIASVAVLPLLILIDAALPPAAVVDVRQSIAIAAPPSEVWRALTSDEAIAEPPGLVAWTGLAVPIRGRLLGHGVGTTRLGEFSTGVAVERVTAWEEGRRLSFAVLSEPPIMVEMSPWETVHAPHVSGYVTVRETTFRLQPLPGGRTRLTATAGQTLRIDPVLYWLPLARWATERNLARVLRDVDRRAERRGG